MGAQSNGEIPFFSPSTMGSRNTITPGAYGPPRPLGTTQKRPPAPAPNRADPYGVGSRPGAAASSRVDPYGAAPQRGAPLSRSQPPRSYGIPIVNLATGAAQAVQGAARTLTAPGRSVRSNPADPYGVGPALPQVSNMRPQDNRPQDYPAGVSRGVPSAPARQAPPVAPPRQAPSAVAAAPVRSAPMPGFGTPRVEIRAGGRRAAALNNQAQQAGSTARYASAGDDVRLAADTRSRMIGDARAAGSEIPASLTPASESYWNDADIRKWATSSPGNLKLANDLRRENGLPDLDANGQGPWAAPNVTWSGVIDRNPAVAYGMKGSLAPGAAQAAPAWSIPAETWNAPGRADLAFDPSVDLTAQQRFQAPASAWNMQSKFNPNLDLGLSSSAAPEVQGASAVPVATRYGPEMDLMGGGAPSNAAAASYGDSGAQALNQRALEQIRRMKPSGYSSASGLSFNPQAFRSQGSSYL